MGARLLPTSLLDYISRREDTYAHNILNVKLNQNCFVFDFFVMKLFTCTFSVALASHYRGGSYQFAPNGSGSIDVTATQTWRDGMSGYFRKLIYCLT